MLLQTDYISSILIFYPGEIKFEIFSDKLSTGFELIWNVQSEIFIVMLLVFVKGYKTVLVIRLNIPNAIKITALLHSLFH